MKSKPNVRDVRLAMNSGFTANKSGAIIPIAAMERMTENGQKKSYELKPLNEKKRRVDLKDVALSRFEYVRARSTSMELTTRLDDCISMLTGRSGEDTVKRTVTVETSRNSSCKQPRRRQMTLYGQWLLKLAMKAGDQSRTAPGASPAKIDLSL